MTLPGGPDLVLAVDCSSTASKAVVFDPSGAALGVGRHPIPLQQPSQGRHEQRAQDWWSATCSAVRQAVVGVDLHRVGSLVVTHQRETFCCLQGESELRPAIVWMDTRAQRLVRTLGSDEVHAISGRPPDNTPSFYKLAWLAQEEPLVIERATRIGDVGAYLNLRLTGRWASSWAGADSTGLMDMQNRTWSQRLCDLAGVRPDQLPEPVRPGSVIGALTGEAAAELGLLSGLQVVAAAGDGQCAAVGAGVLVPGSLYLNIGTAIVSGTISLDYQWGRDYRTVAAADGESFLFEALLSTGTYLVNWFSDSFGPFDAPGLGLTTEEVLEVAAKKLSPGADGLLVLPYWNGAQTPHWDASARGAVVGWTGIHGRTHLYRAILEGIALELRLQTEGLSTAVGTRPERLIVTGGGSRSDLWLQIIADVLDRTLEIPAEPETTALGAAMLGMVAQGLYADLPAANAAIPRRTRSVEPDSGGTEVYTELWTVYRTLYDSLRPALESLSAFSATGRASSPGATRLRPDCTAQTRPGRTSSERPVLSAATGRARSPDRSLPTNAAQPGRVPRQQSDDPRRSPK